jgi:ribonuclease P protein component
VPSPKRLTRTADLLMVRRQGKRVRTPLLEVRVLASLLRHHRFGLVVPRHKHTAVDRNRLKRRLRELVRETWPSPLETMSPSDVVLYALPSAYAVDFATLRSDLIVLATRLMKQVPAA